MNRETQHVVDLVGIIRASGGDDRIRANRIGLFRHDLGNRIGHGEDDRLLGHFRHPFGLERARGREAEEDVGAHERLFEAAGIGRHGMCALPLVDTLTPRIDRPGAIADDDVLVGDAHRLDQRGAGERRSTRAVHHHAHVGEIATRQVAGVEQAGGGDNGGAVLVVMHHRHLHPLAQLLLDDEAFGRLDVLEVDAAEAWLHEGDRVDEGFGILGVEFDVDRIDVGEALEQYRLAFHHRLRGERAEIAHSKDRGSVGNHRHQVGARGVACGAGRIVGDRLDRDRHAGRISEAEVALGGHRLRGDDLDLTGPIALVIEQRLAIGEAGPAVFCQDLSPSLIGALMADRDWR